MQQKYSAAGLALETEYIECYSAASKQMLFLESRLKIIYVYLIKSHVVSVLWRCRGEHRGRNCMLSKTVKSSKPSDFSNQTHTFTVKTDE